jgi:serine-type D-Ala-D-Ala carboxypeptidase/endopeptidase (penicillin-binding protein 4)
MLELFSSGLLSLWLEKSSVSPTQTPLDPAAVVEQIPLWVTAQYDDKTAANTISQSVNELSALGMNADEQGLWLQTDYQTLGSNRGTTRFPAASLTKAATSLVALKTWGPNHQFETQVGTTGIVQGQVLVGDLVIQGGGDPLFVWEPALELGNALNRLGIQQVTGNLIIEGDFAMNYERDPQKAGELLRQALDSRQWPAEGEFYYNKLPIGTPKPLVEIIGTVKVASEPIALQQVLLRHQSVPLVQLLKQMNIYSSNAMSEMIGQALGGGSAIAQKAAGYAAIPTSELQLINGSGLGQENQMSARAACAIFKAIQRNLQQWTSPTGATYTIADLFPVSTLDGGTIKVRNIPASSVVKTGTLSDVSALSGVVPTRDRGLVWFAILNRGTDIDELRRRQDQTLQTLIARWGEPLSMPSAVTPTLYNTTPQSGRDLADQDY